MPKQRPTQDLRAQVQLAAVMIDEQHRVGQIVTMLLWVVRLRQLFDQLDGLVEAKMMTSGADGGGLFDMRLKAFPDLVQYLRMLIDTCCQPPWHRSTLIDILIKNLTFSRVLDYHLIIRGAAETLEAVHQAVKRRKNLALHIGGCKPTQEERQVIAQVHDKHAL